ncbi:immunoglobulin domain-containing protein, partial [bacterium]|nr:immunoglobulin domain-containing protein [bacterium]
LLTISTVTPPPGGSGPPVLETQPANQTVQAGSRAEISFVISGAQPMQYQWRRELSLIAGATDPTYVIDPVQSSDAARYWCRITNSEGHIDTRMMTLTVEGQVTPEPPVIQTQPVSRTVNEGDSISFTISATGTAPLAYQWRKNGVNIGGANSSTYSISSAQALDAGAYSCAVSNSAGSVVSNGATLTVNSTPPPPGGSGPPVLETQPANQTVQAGSRAEISFVVSGALPMQFQWRREFSLIAGATNPTYVIDPVQSSDAARYWCRITNSEGHIDTRMMTLTVEGQVLPDPPVIQTQPISRTVNEGDSISFTVSATGTAPLAYQWRKNGVNISGANSNTHSITSAQVSDAGTYSCAVSNSAGTAVSNGAVLEVIEDPGSGAPVIQSEPSNATFQAGQTIQLSVTVTGSTPLQYQWRKEYSLISGATSAIYQIPNADSSDGARYWCRITNAYGHVDTRMATITVEGGSVSGPPVITTQPANLSIRVGQPLAVTVGASGSGLTYQWRKDYSLISGATSATYSIGAASTGDAGRYWCRVSNSEGHADTLMATVTVSP